MLELLNFIMRPQCVSDDFWGKKAKFALKSYHVPDKIWEDKIWGPIYHIPMEEGWGILVSW